MDVGSHGNMYEPYLSSRCKYVGLDLIGDVDVVGDAHSLPFRDDVFDYVLLFDVIEHSTLYGLMLEEVKRVLKEGGELILSTIWIIGPSVHRNPEHVHCYTVRLLKRVLARHGFEVLKAKRSVDVIFAVAKNMGVRP